ncbi:MAG: choice-of-anchor Q domain-containing protein [Lysobacterales bacterium]
MNRSWLIVTLTLVIAPHGWAATTVNVNSPDQEVTLAEPGGLPNGNCTLGEAILSVNNLAVGGATVDGCIGATSGEVLPYEITLAPGTRYPLTEIAAQTSFGPSDIQPTALPLVTRSMTIASPAGGPRATIERANGADRFGLLTTLDSVELTTRNLIIANGDADRGGALRTRGNLVSETTLWRDNQAGFGGAIDGFSVSMVDSQLSNNQAISGGALIGFGVSLIDTVLNNNEAADAGGAILVSGALFITRGEFTNNSAVQGGAVRVIQDVSTLDWQDVIFRENMASGSGGAAWVETRLESRITLERVTFLDNSAQTDGGALAINRPTAVQNPGEISISESVFEDNLSGDFGGALAISSAGNLPPIEIAQTQFLGNQADNGGALSAMASHLELTHGVFTGNSANVAGGAIWDESTQWNTSDNRFSENTAPEAGAWDSNGTGNTFNSSRDEFIGNRAMAGSGGALLSRGTKDLNLAQATFSANQASDHGGAIFHSSTGLLQIQRSTLNQNQAGADGGAIAGGETRLEDSWLYNNIALGDGGALASTAAASVLVIRSTLSGNSAINGGGVSATSPMTLTRSTLFDNQASGLGGGLYLPGFRLDTIDATVVDNPDDTNGCAFEADQVFFRNTIALGSDGRSCPCDFINGPNLVYCGSQPAGPAATIVELTLTDNGGPTPTLLPLTSGPAVNLGEPNFGGDIDQRGFSRIVDGIIDIGAVELGAGFLFELGDQVFSSSFEEDGTAGLQRWNDRDAFLSVTGAADSVGTLAPGGNLGQVSAQRGSITYTYFGASGLNIGCQWSDLIPDNGSSSCEDLALNGPEDLDITTDAPVSALGFDFLDPDGNGSAFEITVCASAFSANDTFQNGLNRRCPAGDTLDIFRFNAPDNLRYFVGVSSQREIRQVSIREVTSNSANEYFGHVYTSPQ